MADEKVQDYTNDDTDGDGTPDYLDPTDDRKDTDGDGVPDEDDLDSDGDGVLDGSEDDNTDGDNDPATNPTDTDGDGLTDYEEKRVNMLSEMGYDAFAVGDDPGKGSGAGSRGDYEIVRLDLLRFSIRSGNGYRMVGQKRSPAFFEGQRPRSRPTPG